MLGLGCFYFDCEGHHVTATMMLSLCSVSRHFDILLLECRRQPSSLCYRCCVDLLALSSPPLSWGSRHPIILALSATELGCLNGLGVRSGGSWSSGPIVREPNRRPTLKLS
ncbi:hypothetical protein V6N13_046307 [Hibiscus sabdariffa]|uniref:Uncharacterized protein n=1 Tax=Hibiscus sabdariffa TaxID=183260 RepID=A0ABR1ZPJ4_9ROSI